MSPEQYERVLEACRARGEICAGDWYREGACCAIASLFDPKPEHGFSADGKVDRCPERLAARLLCCQEIQIDSFIDGFDTRGGGLDAKAHDVDWFAAGVRMRNQLETEGLLK